MKCGCQEFVTNLSFQTEDREFSLRIGLCSAFQVTSIISLLRQHLAEPRRPVGSDQSAFSPTIYRRLTGTGTDIIIRYCILGVIAECGSDILSHHETSRSSQAVFIFQNFVAPPILPAQRVGSAVHIASMIIALYSPCVVTDSLIFCLSP